jgi:hypothetical protein
MILNAEYIGLDCSACDVGYPRTYGVQTLGIRRQMLYRMCYIAREAVTLSNANGSRFCPVQCPRGQLPVARKLLPVVKGPGQLERGKTTHDVRRRGFRPSGPGKWREQDRTLQVTWSSALLKKPPVVQPLEPRVEAG